MTVAVVNNVLVLEVSVDVLRALELRSAELKADGLAVPVEFAVARSLVREALQRRAVVVGSRPLPLPTAGRTMGAKAAAKVLGVSDRAVRFRALGLGGTKVAGCWQFDAEQIEKNRRAA